MSRIAANEWCLLKKPGDLDGNVTWKVTARYVLHVTKTKRMRCVRVSRYGMYQQHVVHMSEAEFCRLFRKVEAADVKRMKKEKSP